MLENRNRHTICLDPDFHYKSQKYLHVASNLLRKSFPTRSASINILHTVITGRLVSLHC